MTGRFATLRRIGCGLGALAALLGLTIAVPYVLWRLVGWPLPTAAPSAHQVLDGLTQDQISDRLLVDILAIVGWCAWFQVLVSLLAELTAWVRRKPSPDLSLGGPLQPAVRALVGALMFMLSSNVSAPAAVPLVSRPAVIELRTERPAIAEQVVLLAAPVSVSTQPAPTFTYTVVRRDTLWGLAEQHLGDPLRWHELFDQNRDVAQADGRALTDPNLIIPGWVLTFPSDAIGLSPSAAPPTPASAQTATSPSGNSNAVPSPPSGELRGPSTSKQSGVAPEATVTTLFSGTSSRPRDPAEGRPVRGHSTGRSLEEPLFLLGSGLAAAGVVALLNRVRRARQRGRALNARAVPPEPWVAEAELVLRHEADLDGATFLDLALRALAADLVGHPCQSCRVLAVRSHHDAVEILLSTPLPDAPDGFESADGGHSWRTREGMTLDRLRTLAAGAAAPLPSLFSLGQLESGELLIDLESVGLLTVDGDEQGVQGLVRSIALQLGSSQCIDHVELLYVGEDEIEVRGSSRIRRVESIDDALDELVVAADSIGGALAMAAEPSTFAGRLTDSGADGWIPTVLVTSADLDPTLRDRLVEVVGGGGRGVGAVVRSTTHAEWHAQVEHGQLSLAPLGYAIVPTALDDATLDVVNTLFEYPVLTEEASGPGPNRPPYCAPKPGARVSQDFDVEIRVLGPVEVVGLQRPFDRRKCEELAVYLGLHPAGASDDRLMTVLWATTPERGTFNTTVSMTRSALGRDTRGELRFPHYGTAGRRYRLESTVTTDLARFEGHLALARNLEPSEAVIELRAALELVRGQPFADTRGYEWAYSEGLVANIEVTVADAAHQLAALYLDAGDSAGATWAAERGLKAAPGDEILYRDRMLACDLAGNPAGVEAVMKELCQVVETLDPFDSIHPETLSLYERLRPTRQVAGAG